MEEKDKKKNKPKNNPITQQSLPAWQPTLAPLYVAVLFFVIFILFTAIGVALIVTTTQIEEVYQEYQTRCTPEENLDPVTQAPYCKTGPIYFKLNKTMVNPYLYYGLGNFYQNHRRYSVSRSDKQLGGFVISESEASSACGPIATNSTGAVYHPCGLVAWSMFNDTISLYQKEGDVLLCNGSDPQEENCSKKGIAWASDYKKFQAPTDPTNSPLEYENEAGHKVPDVTDEDFMVWMRTAALPEFRKLYRKINRSLEPGEYYFNVDSRYPVKKFGGKKFIVLTTLTVFGGKSLFLSIAYFVVAGICLAFSVVFLIACVVQKIRSRTAKRSRTA